MLDYTKAIELSPMDPVFWTNRAAVKYELQDNRGTIGNCIKAIEFDQIDPYPYWLRGMSKLKIGEKNSGYLDLSKSGELGQPDANDSIKKYCN